MTDKQNNSLEDGVEQRNDNIIDKSCISNADLDKEQAKTNDKCTMAPVESKKDTQHQEGQLLVSESISNFDTKRLRSFVENPRFSKP